MGTSTGTGTGTGTGAGAGAGAGTGRGGGRSRGRGRGRAALRSDSCMPHGVQGAVACEMAARCGGQGLCIDRPRPMHRSAEASAWAEAAAAVYVVWRAACPASHTPVARRRLQSPIAIMLEIAISNCNHAGGCNLHQARRGSGLEAHRARRIQGDMGEMWGGYAESYGRDLIRWALGRWEHPPSTPALAGPCLWRGPFVGVPWRARIHKCICMRDGGPQLKAPRCGEIAGDGDGDRGRSWGDRGRWC